MCAEGDEILAEHVTGLGGSGTASLLSGVQHAEPSIHRNLNHLNLDYNINPKPVKTLTAKERKNPGSETPFISAERS